MNEVSIRSHGSTVGKPTVIKNFKDAEKFLASLASETINGGTGNEMSAESIIVTLDEIGEEYRQGNISAAETTVLMFSDGGFDLDVARVKEAAAKAADGRPITLAFGAIGSTNAHFKDLVDHNLIGVDNTIYIEFTDKQIENLIKSSAMPPVPVTTAWTEKTWGEINAQMGETPFEKWGREIYRLSNVQDRMNNASPSARVLRQISDRAKSAIQMSHSEKRIADLRKEQGARFFTLDRFSQLTTKLSPETNHRILKTLAEHWAGVPMSDWSHFELKIWQILHERVTSVTKTK
jgi:hypothetical protein